MLIWVYSRTIGLPDIEFSRGKMYIARENENSVSARVTVAPERRGEVRGGMDPRVKKRAYLHALLSEWLLFCAGRGSLTLQLNGTRNITKLVSLLMGRRLQHPV